MRARVAALFLALVLCFSVEHLTSALAQSPGPYLNPNIPGARPAPQRAPTQPAVPLEGGQLPGITNNAASYYIGPGDRLRITVFGEPDLTGEFEINSEGVISFPLVGEVKAGGLTPREAEGRLATLLKNGFLVNPRVNVEVINYRPFFILGEVAKPGGYPFINAMTVVTAVALSGGYTPRANRRKMTIVRTVNQGRQQIDDAAEETVVLPGDVITVHERFF